MRAATVKLEMPVLARLMLSEIADRRGRPDSDVLVEIIHAAAVNELGRDLKRSAEEVAHARADG
jgi:hypothetical protein